MLTLTGNGRLTREVELRSTRSGDSVATVSVASDRRDRKADPVYVDPILWRGQAEAAAQHLAKGQAVAFTGRFEPREYTTRDGRQGVAWPRPGADAPALQAIRVARVSERLSGVLKRASGPSESGLAAGRPADRRVYVSSSRQRSMSASPSSTVRAPRRV